jgi:drug/metabolite transporter (DMT)-like permease
MELRWTTPFSVSLQGAALPVLAAGLAVRFGKERLAWRTVLGLALALSGSLSRIGIGSVDLGAILVSVNCPAAAQRSSLASLSRLSSKRSFGSVAQERRKLSGAPKNVPAPTSTP